MTQLELVKRRPLRGWKHLLWAQWRSLRNGPQTKQGKEKIRILFFGSLAVLFMFGMGWGARWLFSQFLQAEFLAELLIKRVLDITLLFFGGLLIFSNLIAGFTTYLLADDMVLLMTVPIPTGRLYLARLVQTWAQSSWMMLVFAVPVFAAVGPVLGSPWWFYVSIPLVLLPMTIICSAVGSYLTLMLARWLPARRTRDFLVVLTIIGFLVMYIAFRFAEPEKFLEPDGFNDLVALVAGLRGGESPLLPTAWCLEILTQFARGEVQGTYLSAMLLWAGAGTSVALGVWLARSILVHSFMTAQEGQVGRHLGRGRTETSNRRGPARYPANAVHAIQQRDTRIFLRTTGQWTQLLLVGALVIVYLFNFKHFRALQETNIIGSLGIFFINFALSGLVVTTLVVRFLYPAVSLEGKAYWALQVAPISGRQILKGKIRWAAWPLTLVSGILAIGSGLITNLPYWMVGASFILAAITTIGLMGLGTGMGGIWPQFHLSNPTRIASGLGGVLFMLIGLAYLVATAVLVGWPLSALRTFIETGYVPRTVKLVQMGACVLGAIVISIATYWIPMKLGAQHLDTRDG